MKDLTTVVYEPVATEKDYPHWEITAVFRSMFDARTFVRLAEADGFVGPTKIRQFRNN